MGPAGSSCIEPAFAYNGRPAVQRGIMNQLADQSIRADAGSMKETIESIVVAFILAFVFRAFVVEAFVIPTGSMAPTLLGKHVRMSCPMCGYDFAADVRDRGVHRGTGREEPLLVQGRGNNTGRGELAIDCPMCEYPIRQPRLRTKPGDRILVLKYVYAMAGPRRWDVVVFRNPERSQINYIKRLVGLPNESIWIVRGNVYTRPLDPATGAPSGPWRVQAKPAGDQRAVWQPVYHSRYVPLDAEQRGWRTPWQPVGAGWRLVDRGRSFVFDPDAEEGGGALRFDFDADPRFGRDYYAYNKFPTDGHAWNLAIEELRVGATLTPESTAAEPPAMTLTVANEGLAVRGRIDAEGRATLEARADERAAWQVVAEGTAQRWGSTRPRRVELWYVDQTATLWVDETAVAVFERPIAGTGEVPARLESLAVDLEALHEAGPPRRRPDVRLELEGAPASLSQVNLDRDLYYTAQGTERATDRPADLRSRQYFVLGDNSPQSKDSRRLDAVDPWVRFHTRDEHGPGGVPTGLVPEKLLVGRAFFVYFPAPYALSPTMFPFVPNFGDMRFIK